MPSEDLQRLIRAGGQVVHTDILILTACRDHIPTGSEKGRRLCIKPWPCVSNYQITKHFYFDTINPLDRTIVKKVCQSYPAAAWGDLLMHSVNPTEKYGWCTEVLLVVLAPVTSKYSSRMFVLVENFTINGPDDTVVSTIKKKILNARLSMKNTYYAFLYNRTNSCQKSREDENLPESISTTGSNPLRIFMAPWYTEYTILTMLGDDREVYIFRGTGHPKILRIISSPLANGKSGEVS